MAFRADEAAKTGFEGVISYLIPRFGEVDEAERARSRKALTKIIDELGPVVDSYPSWHPLVSNQPKRSAPVLRPNEECGYSGLDHTCHFARGFISVPYGAGQANLIEKSVSKLPDNRIASITSERLNVRLFRSGTAPVVVRCEWQKPLLPDGTIPASIATPLILLKELPNWEWSSFGESWETMRPYFLGRPHGSRSSLFINQQTGQQLRKIWEAIVDTGMFGSRIG